METKAGELMECGCSLVKNFYHTAEIDASGCRYAELLDIMRGLYIAAVHHNDGCECRKCTDAIEKACVVFDALATHRTPQANNLAHEPSDSQQAYRDLATPERGQAE